MKTSIIKVAFAAVIAIAATGFASGQGEQTNTTNVSYETKGPVTITWASASLPAWDTNPNAKGVSWDQASINWMECIRSGATSVGTGNATAKKITYADHPGMITTAAFQSWRGSTATPASVGERGGRQHFGYKLSVGSGTFIPAQVTFSLTSQIWSLGGWVNTMYIAVSDTMNVDNNQFRYRLDAGADNVFGTSDDTVSASQIMMSPSGAFIYGGYGVGVNPFGAGDNQGMMTNTLNYLQSGKLRVLVTVNVPHSNGSVYTFTNVYMPPPQPNTGELILEYTPIIGGDPAFLSWSSSTDRLFEIQKSTDCLTWTTVGLKGGFGLLRYFTNDQALGSPKYFYRISRVW